MKRSLLVATVAAGLLGGGVVSATPSQAAATITVKTGPLALCYPSATAACGGYLWIKLPWSKVPEDQRNSWFSYSLKNSKGKRVRLGVMTFANIPGGPDGMMFDKPFDYPPVFYRNDRIGPLFQLPRNLKAGKYKLAVKIDASGYWDCSITYHDVCRWQRPYVWKKTITVRLRAYGPLQWAPSG